jgi:hypothetical protein
MIKIDVDTGELLKWARYMNRVPKRTGAAISRALNTVGDNILRVRINTIAENTGFDPDEIESAIEVKKATPNDLSWSMDASKLSTDNKFSRPWQTRGDSNSDSFDDRTLVKVVTSGDEYVCDKCNYVADHSPYTMQEIHNMNPYGMEFGSGTNLVHPNCRCITQAWQATRMLPVSIDSGGTQAPAELFTMRQLGEAIAGELQVEMKATD